MILSPEILPSTSLVDSFLLSMFFLASFIFILHPPLFSPLNSFRLFSLTSQEISCPYPSLPIALLSKLAARGLSEILDLSSHMFLIFPMVFLS